MMLGRRRSANQLYNKRKITQLKDSLCLRLELREFRRTRVTMVIPYVVVGNPNELAVVSGVGYSEPRFISDGFAVVVACFHKVTSY